MLCCVMFCCTMSCCTMLGGMYGNASGAKVGTVNPIRIHWNPTFLKSLLNVAKRCHLVIQGGLRSVTTTLQWPSINASGPKWGQ